MQKHAWAPALMVAAALSGTARAEAFRAWEGSTLAGADVERILGQDDVVVRLTDGEQLQVFDQRIIADGPARLLLALSSQFLSMAVTSGEIRLESGTRARAGQVLVIGLDQTEARQLMFDARQLGASLAPGARPLIGDDLSRLARSQSRGDFFGLYEPVSVNARSPGSPQAEWRRQGYLADPVVVRIRREAAARRMPPGQRVLAVVDVFLTAVASSDSTTIAALLDPRPFMAAGSPERGLAARRAAAERLGRDPALRSALDGPVQRALSEDRTTVNLTTPTGQWRLGVVIRDGAPFISNLEATP